MEIDIQTSEAKGLRVSRIFDHFGRPRVSIAYVDASRTPEVRKAVTVDPFHLPALIGALAKVASECEEFRYFPGYLEEAKKEARVFFEKK